MILCLPDSESSGFAVKADPFMIGMYLLDLPSTQ
jgi:hypothetical protein